MVLYVLLAPFDHEQSDLMHRVFQEKKLEQLPVYRLEIVCYSMHIPMHIGVSLSKCRAEGSS